MINLEGLDMPFGTFVGQIVTTARGNRFVWQGDSWLWVKP